MTSRRHLGFSRDMQRVIVLAGLPGSGKSTLAHRLHAVGWAWVNQDVLGSRRACEDAVIAALATGAEVVVDRCNFDEQQRQTWVALARRSTAVPIGLQLHVPVEECIRRVCLRSDHPTLAAGNAPDIIARFAHDFRPFRRHEGFAEVHVAFCQADVEAFVARMGPARQHAPLPAPAAYRQPHAPLGPALPAFRPVSGGTAFAAQQAGAASMAPAAQQDHALGAAGVSWNTVTSTPAAALRETGGGAPALAPVPGLPSMQPGSPGERWARKAPLASADPPSMTLQRLPPQPGLLTPAPMPGAGPGERQEQQQQQSSNAVPFPGGRGRAAQGAPAPGSLGSSGQPGFLDEGAPDGRPILLFDLNGTLTSHTAARRSAGVNLMRPGIHHLMRLHDTFRIGIFSSASQRTVSAVVPMLEAAARSGGGAEKTGKKGPKLLPEGGIMLTRQHTEAAPKEHTANGGKSWDTVKPLSKWFRHMDRVILVDDDAYKAMPGEEQNMIVVPRWEETQDDSALEALVNALLAAMGRLSPSEDVRLHTKAVQEVVAAAAADAAAERGARAACNSKQVGLHNADTDAEHANASMPESFNLEVAAVDQQQALGLVMV